MLSLQFSLVEAANRESVLMTETTGVYDANHLNAWNAPNVTLASATHATVQISKREADGTYTDATIINAFPTLPSGTSGTLSLTATGAGYGDTFEDGIYKFVYTVKNDTGEAIIWSYSTTEYKILYGDIKCCFLTKAKEAVLCGECICENEDFMCFFTQYRLLELAIYEYETLGIDVLDEIQTFINSLGAICESDETCSNC